MRAPERGAGGSGSVAVHTGVATARVGVAGNPSDALGGAALAVPIPELRAEVRLGDADRITIAPAGGYEHFDDVAGLVAHTSRYGHDGGDRLVRAAIVCLARHCEQRGIDVDGAPFAVTWSTAIPRSVGLAGSSAVIVATLRALSARWGVDLDPLTVAALAYEAENSELGVTAGWMDRVVQAHARPTLVDAREHRVHSGHDVPAVRVVGVRAPIQLVVAWDPAGAAPSGRLHASLHERIAAGDPEAIAVVGQLVDAATGAADALASGDRAELAGAVDRTCALRDRLGALDEVTRGLARLARTVGAAATSAGSGGAVVVVPRGDPGEVLDAFAAAGATTLVSTVAASSPAAEGPVADGPVAGAQSA